MRAHMKGKHGMGKRFAIVIGVAAVGVMALVAQTGAQTQAPTPRGQAPPTCKGLAATIVGTEAGDNVKGSGRNLTGTSGPDVIVGLGGADILRGGPGNDVICGGKGRDLLEGGRGNDTLLGQAGKDSFFGKAGKDRCVGGKGFDNTTGFCQVEKSIERSGTVSH
jgi:Ca2+-binding RTX toxin-like protein